MSTAIEGGIDAARAAATQADVVLLYVGEPASSTGEAASTVSITIPLVQEDLVEAIIATGKPVVLMLKHGRALALSNAMLNAKAILCTWFLGSQAGHAIADVLFGKVAPQGRLPVSFPHASGQEPFFYDHRSTGRPQTGSNKMFKARYTEQPNGALFPFGFGLGFSTVEYGKTEVMARAMPLNGSVKVRATVTNTGVHPQHEVVQLYVHVRVASVTQPVRALKGVKHVDLQPGQQIVAEFDLSAHDLAYVHADLTDHADAGLIDVWISPSSVAGIAATLEIAENESD